MTNILAYPKPLRLMECERHRNRPDFALELIQLALKRDIFEFLPECRSVTAEGNALNDFATQKLLVGQN